MLEAHVWTVRDGRLLRLRVYRSRAEGLEAAGLRGVGDVAGDVEIVRGHIEAFTHDAPRARSFLDPFVVADVVGSGPTSGPDRPTDRRRSTER